MPTRTSILCLALSLCAPTATQAGEPRSPSFAPRSEPLAPSAASPGPARESGVCVPAPAADPNNSIGATISRLPRTIELVVIVSNARGMFDLPIAQSTWNIVTDLDSADASGVRKSWDDLAGQLGWPKPETLDRLIGSQFMLVMQDVDKDETRRWAVVSAISEQTDRQLKDRLRPARRNIVDGHPIFSIEQGKYEVTSHLNAPAAPAAAAAERSVSLLLAEADKTQLFDELIGIFSRRPPDSLAGTEVPREAEKLGRADVFVALRLDPEDPAKDDPANAWRNFLLVAARRNATGWECDVVLRDSESEKQLAAIPRTSDAPLRALSKDALVAVLEAQLKSANPTPSNPIERLFAMLGLPLDVQNHLSGRQLLSIRSTAPDAPVQPPGAPAPDPRLSITIGAETPDLQKLAPLGDAFMDDALKGLENKLQLPRPDARPDMNLGGVACGAIRNAVLEVPVVNPIAKFFDVPLRFSWTFTARPGMPQPGPQQPNDPKLAPNKAPGGWWLVNVGPADSLPAISKSLRDPDPIGNVGRWYSIGIVRPARCVPFFNNILPGLSGWQAALGRIDSVRWYLAVGPNKDVIGTVTVEMAKPK